MFDENSTDRQVPAPPHHTAQSAELAIRARDSLSKLAQFRGRANCFTFALQGDTLVVRGAVPSYYLKQLLQTALKNLEGIRQIDNQVVVTATNGVASEFAAVARREQRQK